LAKRVALRPEWLESPVDDIYSISGCISEDFANYIEFWRHNGYWLFDSVEVIREIAREHSIDLGGCRFFYYEIHEHEYCGEQEGWRTYERGSFPTEVRVPDFARIEGFDVATASLDNTPECSPLSCNSLAKKIPVNRHCLLATFEEAKQLLENGAFEESEPGPYRIFAVYSLDEP